MSDVEMLLCKKCGETKPRAEFVVRENGWIRSCRPCHRAMHRAFRANNLEAYKAREKAREQRPLTKQRHKEFSRSEKGKAFKKRYLKANPLKHAAHVAVANGKRNGSIVPEPCQNCGAKADAHHCDYTKPLEIMWLCVEHHKEWHRRNKAFCPKQPESA